MSASTRVLRLLLHVARREILDHGARTLALAALFGALALALGTQNGAHALPHAAVAVGIVAPFASLGLVSTVVDDGASGFLRLVATTPLPRGAYAALRILGLTALLVATALPLVVGVSLYEGAPLGLALGALLLVALWSAAASVLLGLLVKGPASATGLWLFWCVVNLLGILATWPGMAMDDWLVRARHALPGPIAVEILTAGSDPWLWTAPATLAIESALMLAGTIAVARGWRVASATLALSVGVPFLLPAAPGGTR